jgi:hypothetical protein
VAEVDLGNRQGGGGSPAACWSRGEAWGIPSCSYAVGGWSRTTEEHGVSQSLGMNEQVGI